MNLQGERAMKEAIRRCLRNKIAKAKNLLICRPPEQMTGRILPESALESSFHPWLQKVSRHVGFAGQKSDTSRCALISLRCVLIMMSLCLAFLLTIAMQAMVTSP